MIHYIIQIIAFQLLFLIVYDLFLKKETFFVWNRLYLLMTPILSFILPLMKIKAIQETIPEGYFIELPAVLLNGYSQNTAFDGGTLQEVIIIGTQPINLVALLLNIWYIGMGISFIVFVFKIVKIQRLKRSGIIRKLDGVQIVTLPKTDTAFSFFNTMFLGAELSQKQTESILLHERIHIEQRHSLDLLFFEILRILFWFNPLVYVYQHKMVILQEYTADAHAIVQSDKKTYYHDLLAQVFKTESISFINTFFNHSLIKKRIIMLQKSRSSQLAKMKYLYLIPIVFGMLIYTACTDDSNELQSNDGTTIEERLTLLRQSIENSDEISDAEFQEISTLVREASAKHKKGKDSEKIFYEKESKYIEYEDADAVPFAVIEKVPTYPGCSGTNDELKRCMSDKISSYVGKEFDASLGKKLGLSGVNRIFVSFKVNEDGNVVNIRARAPHPDLEEESKRVIRSLPNMIPGQQKGKDVSVLYSLPITFKISE